MTDPDARLVAALHEAEELLDDFDNCQCGPVLADFLRDDRVRDWLAERLREVEPHDGWTDHAYRQVADAILGREA